MRSRHLFRSICFAIVGLFALTPDTSAHVRWFVDDANGSVVRAEVFSWVTPLAIGAIIATLAPAWLAARLAARWRLAARGRVLALPLLARIETGLPRPADLYPWIAPILAIHVAITLFIQGVQRHLFVSSLALPYTLAGGGLALLEIMVAFSLVGGIVVGALTRPAAVGLALVGVLGMAYFGPLLVIEHAYFFGVAAFLFIAGRGPGAVQRVVRGLGRPNLRLLPYAIPILRCSFGVATLLTGFTEKLWNRELSLAFLRDHPFNLTAATPFPLSNGNFVVVAGLAEVTLGALIIVGLWPRLAILVAWIPFNLAVPFLGVQDVIGHIPIYGLLLAILLCGSGRGFAAVLRRNVEQSDAAVAAPDEFESATPATSELVPVLRPVAHSGR